MITGVGSLPHNDVQKAIALAYQHEIPFLPELPKCGDTIREYLKSPGKLSCLEKFSQHEFATVKIQCVGPATAIMLGYNENEAIEKICLHIDTIIRKLHADQIILFLDEPALRTAMFDYASMWSAIFQSFPVIPGVHCCDDVDWDILFKSEARIISFDASQFDITIYPSYRNKKIIAWGSHELADIKNFQTGDILTAPCGLSPNNFSEQDAKNILNKLKQIKKSLLNRD